jgi:hypothetical protein
MSEFPPPFYRILGDWFSEYEPHYRVRTAPLDPISICCRCRDYNLGFVYKDRVAIWVYNHRDIRGSNSVNIYAASPTFFAEMMHAIRDWHDQPEADV